ncbi:MAG: hypothetical protein HY658_06370 [Actinobacteria bacterium]|nr:hypothetical protein [Actinomycetota bacterium]
MPLWISIPVALLIAVAVWKLGMLVLRSMGSAARPTGPQEAEDVEELAVYFVCRECGTELRVTRLGQEQVPRHCGEAMDVVRRPA